MSLENPIPHLHFWFAHPFRPLVSLSCRAHSTPPRLVMSQGTSDSSSGGGRELPGQAGAGHSQTAERGGQCSAGAGQENHQAAPAAAAATRGKEGHWVPSWQVALAHAPPGLWQESWHWGWDVSQISLCRAILKPQADHIKIMWCARTDTWASRNIFYQTSDVSWLFPPPSWHIMPSNKIRTVAEQGFSHFAHQLWVMICFGMHEFKLGHGVLRSSATIYSLRNALMNL